MRTLVGNDSAGKLNHIDFPWSPTGNFALSNPYVDVAKVKQIIKASVTP